MTVLLYSEGFIRPPHLSAFEEVVDDARRANVVVEFVPPQGLAVTATAGYEVAVVQGNDLERSPLMRLETSAGGTAFVAEATGGRSSVSNDTTQIAQRVLRESSAYYLLGYAPPEGRSGERRVKVRVRGEGLEVRARTRYFVGAAALPAPDLPPAGQALRLLEDRDEVAFRVRTLSAGMTTLVVEVSPPELPRERQLRLLVEARPLAGGKAFHDSADVTISATPAPVRFSREWTLAPGVWQARIVLEDVATEQLGSLSHTFEVGG